MVPETAKELRPHAEDAEVRNALGWIVFVALTFLYVPCMFLEAIGVTGQAFAEATMRSIWDDENWFKAFQDELDHV